MNKITKATIATAAGAALLLGGAGTFATWNDDAKAGAAQITAGNLVVDANGGGVWTLPDGSGTTTISNYRVSPGDVLTYTETLNIVAEGNNLTAKLTLTEGSIVAADAKGDKGQQDANDALAAQLTASAVLTATGPGIVQDVITTTDGDKPNDRSFTVTPRAAGTAVPVTVTVTLTFGDLGIDATTNAGLNDASKTGMVNLEDLTVALEQTIATT